MPSETPCVCIFLRSRYIFQIASDYWTRNWASSATFADVIGRAAEEAAYDFQGYSSLNLPDFQCIPDWLENDLPGLQAILSRKELDSLTKQKSLIDLAKFRVNAEVHSSLAKFETSGPGEPRNYRGRI